MEIISTEVIDMENKFKSFIKKNGFLTLLFLGVCIVAGATIFLATRDLGTGSDDIGIVEEKDYENLSMQDLADDDLSREIFSEEQEEDSEEVEDVEEAEEAEEVEEVEEVEKVEEEIEIIESEPRVTGTMSLPVEGEILTEFTKDSLIYSQTLDEWRTHLGLDIKASINTKVKAPMDGVIKSVYEDELWGKVIVIDHGDGLESRLANLGTTEMVREGLEILKGDHIATVGKSAKIEILMEEHLHFEVIKDGKNIDPRSIIH